MGRFARTKFFLRNAWSSFRADAGLGIVGSPSPDSDYWYHSVGMRSGAGPTVTPATATRLGAVFACTRVVTETFGSLPCAIYRERKSGGRDRATDHPAQELFLYPNEWQTGMEFFEMMQGHLELRGNAYAVKVPGNGRAIDQLIPLHPDRVRVFLLPNNRLRYEVSQYSTGRIDRYSQDEILHLRGWTFDGVMGISTVSAMAESIGVGIAQQEHRAAYFHNHAIPGMAIETVKMDEEAREQMVNSISERFSGPGAFKVFAPPPGSVIKMLGLTNKDSQLIEASQATRTEICAAWRVPPHKIADLTRGTFSNIEQQNIEFATDCMRPRIVRFERRLDRDIVASLRAYESSPGDYYMTFNMDALFRGDMKSRYEAYSQALPWMARNEIRAAEGRNPIEDPACDELLVPVNLETISQAQKRNDANNAAANESSTDNTDSGAERDQQDSGGSPETPSEDNQGINTRDAHLQSLVLSAAGRLVRREVKALRKLQSSSGAFHEKQLLGFYADLAPVIAENLAIPIEAANKYCSGHALTLTTAKSSLIDFTLDLIEEDGPQTLATIALGEQKALKAAPVSADHDSRPIHVTLNPQISLPPMPPMEIKMTLEQQKTVTTKTGTATRGADGKLSFTMTEDNSGF